MLKSMSEFKYVQGLKTPVRFTDKQVKIVKLNGNVSRHYYNKLVELNTKRYKLQQTLKLIEKSLKDETNLKIISQKMSLIKSLKQDINHIKELSKITNARNILRFLYSDKLDSDIISQTKRNYQAAWNMYHKVHNNGTPQFKRFSNEWCYCTPTHYYSKHKSNANLTNGSVRFIDLAY